jgi:hypothetical protein
MATLPINLEIEDVAVGPVLVLLKRTPGVISIRLPFLEHKPTPAAPRTNGLNIEQTVVQLFAKHHGGPLLVDAITAEIGGGRTRAYGAVHNLKKKGILELVGKGEYKFSAKAMHMMQKGASSEATTAPLALPKPKHHAKGNGKTKIVKTASGRAKQGAGPAALRELLSEKGPMKHVDIKQTLDSKGVSAKSISGIIERGRRDGIIRKLPSGEYELTARGKQSSEASAGA